MIIGDVVEGATDEAFLEGLRNRWCPQAELMRLDYRGSTARHRDYPKIIAAARLKEVGVLIFLTDCNSRDWKEVATAEREALSRADGDDAVVGVAHRNIECWLCSDVDYIVNRYGCGRDDIDSPDPKAGFEKALRITRDDKKVEEIAALVHGAPLKNWINRSRSFKHFYDDLRALSRAKGCRIPDELSATGRQRR